MMNPDTFQLIAGIAYVQELDREQLSETPFAKFDVLTPDEPGWVWQFGKRLLNIPHQVLTAHLFHKPSKVVDQQSFQITVR